MTIIYDDRPVRTIKSLSESDLPKARAYIRDAVYDWCKNKPNEVFAVRDLFGGVNTDWVGAPWAGTPLQAIYSYWSSWFMGSYPSLTTYERHQKVLSQAARDVGCLMKQVLQDDERKFESCNAGGTKGYKWVGGN